GRQPIEGFCGLSAKCGQVAKRGQDCYPNAELTPIPNSHVWCSKSWPDSGEYQPFVYAQRDGTSIYRFRCKGNCDCGQLCQQLGKGASQYENRDCDCYRDRGSVWRD